MNVLHLSTYDFGGAGKAAYRLHRNFLAQDFDSRMVVLDSRTGDPRVTALIGARHPFRLWNFVMKAWLKITTNQDYYFQDQTSSPIRDANRLFDMIGFKPDVIVAHWVSSFFTAKDLCDLNRVSGVPIVWYLMDMAPLTGGCHYAWDCNGFTEKCGNCPALYSINNYDLSHRNWKMKHNSIKKTDMTVVAATGWLDEQAKNASVCLISPWKKK